MYLSCPRCRFKSIPFQGSQKQGISDDMVNSIAMVVITHRVLCDQTLRMKKGNPQEF